MARQVVWLDDITDEPGAQPREFTIEGQIYDIDLTDEGWQEVLDLLKPFMDSGRKRGAKTPAPKMGPADSHLDHGTHSREERDAVRDFMDKHGILINNSGKGRVPVDIWRAWRTGDLNQLVAGRIPGRQTSIPKGRRSSAVKAAQQLPMDDDAATA